MYIRSSTGVPWEKSNIRMIALGSARLLWQYVIKFKGEYTAQHYMHHMNNMSLVKVQSINHCHGEDGGVGIFDTDEIVRVFVPQTSTTELHSRFFPERPDANVGDNLISLKPHLLDSL